MKTAISRFAPLFLLLCLLPAFASAQALVGAHPSLASWIDIGDSWDKLRAGGAPGYDLMVLRLTNAATPGPKPKLNEKQRQRLGKMLDKAKNKGDLKPYLRNLNVRWFAFDLSADSNFERISFVFAT